MVKIGVQFTEIFMLTRMLKLKQQAHDDDARIRQKAKIEEHNHCASSAIINK